MSARDGASFWLGDRYCGLVKLGSGGMGEVWAGKAFGDHGFEQIVAIKRLHVDRCRMEADHRALLDEAMILQHLSASPNIVSVIDLRDADGQPALILEYIDGPELRDVLKLLSARGERLPFPILAFIMTEVSKALSYAHQCCHPKTAAPLGIIHRDVTPSNIMISSAGAVKLTDFGIAKSEIQTVETHVGEIKGKFAYMSPEQARGRKLDYRSDYFALGLVLFECFYGRPAYQAKSDAAFIEQARSASIDYPHQAGELDPIFKRLLACEPSKRYTDLDEFRRDLASASIQLCGMATSVELRRYLAELGLPQLDLAVERRRNLEQVQPSPQRSDPEATHTGALSVSWILAHWKPIAATSTVFIVAAVSAWLLFRGRPSTVQAFSPATTPPVPASHSSDPTAVPSATGVLNVNSDPVGAVISVLNGSHRIASQKAPAQFTDLPLGTRLNVSASFPEYASAESEVTLTPVSPELSKTFVLKKRQSVTVRFTADPPSSFSIPGLFRNQDAPSPPLSVPTGKYRVTFSNPLASSPATANLDAAENGRYRCHANMRVDPATGTSNGTPQATCQKE